MRTCYPLEATKKPLYMSNRDLELLKELLTQAEDLPLKDTIKLDALKRRTTLLIKKIFGETSDYISSIKLISFRPHMVISTLNGPTDPGPYNRAWEKGKEKYINFVKSMIDDVLLSIELEESNKDQTIVTKDLPKKNGDIFIVHGHNEEMKQAVARVIEKLQFKPIILHEQANKGRTIIQKFIDHSNVGFAIVLMSADDYGYSKDEQADSARPRARQNVILELGFFLGKLGAERVVAIFEETDNFETPTDYDGVIFVPYDKDGHWRFKVIRELKELGYNVDANSII